jgi:hypothetical protein
MTVVSDGENPEKIIVFGGLQNKVETTSVQNSVSNFQSRRKQQEHYYTQEDLSKVSSNLSNKTFMITV